jgi:site-specific DNA-methyltransferase (adenine-specific)
MTNQLHNRRRDWRAARNEATRIKLANDNAQVGQQEPAIENGAPIPEISVATTSFVTTKPSNDNELAGNSPFTDICQGDCRELLKTIPDASVDMSYDDPPYFIKGMGDDWDNAKLLSRSRNPKKIGHLPAGQAFDRKQGYEFETYMGEIASEMFRVLKPGAFFIVSSQARLYHRAACAVEDAGFEIRDMLAWQRQGLPRAQTMDHFLKLAGEQDNEELGAAIGGRKTAMLNQTLEPMILAQKPRDGTYVENWRKWGVGLADVTQTLEPGCFPTTLMSVRKPTQAERDVDGNNHLTVKPVPLMEHLLRMFSKPGDVILDPHLGSGTTGVAAVLTGRSIIGFERDAQNVAMAKARIESASTQSGQVAA